jgi:hypothetical protein
MIFMHRLRFGLVSRKKALLDTQTKIFLLIGSLLALAVSSFGQAIERKLDQPINAKKMNGLASAGFSRASFIHVAAFSSSFSGHLGRDVGFKARFISSCDRRLLARATSLNG